jgi:formamidopyrimidine-DNA glycosylase
MSIELSEARILAEQMKKELQGKRIEAYHLRNCEKLQKMGFMNKELESFDLLVNREVESVLSRGNTIRVKLDSEVNLILAPEYGGEIFYHKNPKASAERFHLKVDFSDSTALTVRLTSMGGIYVVKDNDLGRSYMFKRDFNPETLSPVDEEFTLERFSERLAGSNRALKSALVGKDAALVGLSNSAFQDILYHAKLHPKRKASELDTRERKALYEAIRSVLSNRIRLKGKDRFLDLYGNRGCYTPAMGPNMKQQKCPACGTWIEKLNVGGGQVFLCPKCQV